MAFASPSTSIMLVCCAIFPVSFAARVDTKANVQSGWGAGLSPKECVEEDFRDGEGFEYAYEGKARDLVCSMAVELTDKDNNHLPDILETVLQNSGMPGFSDHCRSHFSDLKKEFEDRAKLDEWAIEFSKALRTQLIGQNICKGPKGEVSEEPPAAPTCAADSPWTDQLCPEVCVESDFTDGEGFEYAFKGKWRQVVCKMACSGEDKDGDGLPDIFNSIMDKSFLPGLSDYCIANKDKLTAQWMSEGSIDMAKVKAWADPFSTALVNKLEKQKVCKC